MNSQKIEEVFHLFGFEITPAFLTAYHTDPFVYNLTNALVQFDEIFVKNRAKPTSRIPPMYVFHPPTCTRHTDRGHRVGCRGCSQVTLNKLQEAQFELWVEREKRG